MAPPARTADGGWEEGEAGKMTPAQRWRCRCLCEVPWGLPGGDSGPGWAIQLWKQYRHNQEVGGRGTEGHVRGGTKGMT